MILYYLLTFFFYREQTQQRSYYHEGPGPGSGHGHYDRLQRHASNLAIDHHSESSYTSELEPPAIGGYNRDYLSSDDLKGPEGFHGHREAGRYEGGSSQKRPTLGQPFACQNSPTQLHPPEKQQFLKQSEQERDQDPSARQGMRSWRINSFLSTYEDGGEEGLPQPLGPDAFDEAPSAQQVADPEGSTNRYGIKEMPSKLRPDVLRPRFGKPVLPDTSDKDSGPTVSRDILPSTTFNQYMMEKEREKDSDMERDRIGTREGTGDVEMKEGAEVALSKHESFRSRVNPMLMRSSRLRSSLIFSSSTVEKHSGGLGLKPATEEDEDLDHLRTTSIVAQMLEKRKSLNREPFEWRKKTEEKDKEEEEEQKQPDKEKGGTSFKELKDKFQNSSQEIKTSPAEVPSNVTVGSKTQQESSLNMNDPASRLQYFKDLAAKRKASRMGTESALKATEPVEKKPDLLDKTHHSTATHDVPSVSVNPPQPEPKKLDISSRLAELTRRPSISGNRPTVVSPKPPVNQLKAAEPDSTRKAGNASEVQKKDPFKSLKPFPSPNIFRKDQLKLKGLNPRRVSSGEEMLTADATDAEKSELKKSRSHSSSSMMRSDSRDLLNKHCGSNTSINTIGSDGKSEGKLLDFRKKQTQRLKGFLGPKDKDKDKKSGAMVDEKTMRTVMEITEDSSKMSSTSSHKGSSHTDPPNVNHKVSAGTSGPSRYQSSGAVLFSSNLRDDTKVILGQLSNSQKNRQDQDKAGGAKEGDPGEKGLERTTSLRKTLFSRPQTNPQEREGLLKRMESMRKEKKVYSRFEVRCTSQ